MCIRDRTRAWMLHGVSVVRTKCRRPGAGSLHSSVYVGASCPKAEAAQRSGSAESASHRITVARSIRNRRAVGKGRASPEELGGQALHGVHARRVKLDTAAVCVLLLAVASCDACGGGAHQARDAGHARAVRRDAGVPDLGPPDLGPPDLGPPDL